MGAWVCVKFPIEKPLHNTLIAPKVVGLCVSRRSRRCLVVCTSMDGQPSTGGERLRAEQTGERFLPSVSADVHVELPPREERALARIANMGFFSGVRSLVRVQLAPGEERALARGTDVRFFSGMRTLVLVQLLAGEESACARLADVGSFACVSAQMDGQSIRVCERHVAMRTWFTPA